MSALPIIDHTLSVLDKPRRMSDDERARRNAVFEIDTYNGREALVDEITMLFAQRTREILDNFEVGDDMANAVLVRNVIFQVADQIYVERGGDE